MKSRNLRWRKWKSRIMAGLAVLCVAIALIPLASILYTSLARGGVALLSPGFFVQNGPAPCNPATQSGCAFGGVFNAIEGTLILVGLASLIAIPVGLLAGVFLSEYGDNRAGRAVRFLVEVMVGIPSIVVGIFIFALIILAAQNSTIPPTWATSTVAGALALAMIMIPIVARTSDEALGLVPKAVREAALARGIPRYKTILRIVLSTARAAVLTGVLLGVARVAGETAPLIVTSATNLFSFQGIDRPTAALPTTIYFYGLSGVPNYIQDSWGAALVLVLLMLGISIAARLLFWSRSRRLGLGVT